MNQQRDCRGPLETGIQVMGKHESVYLLAILIFITLFAVTDPQIWGSSPRCHTWSDSVAYLMLYLKMYQNSFHINTDGIA